MSTAIEAPVETLKRDVRIPVGHLMLEGDFLLPEDATGVVLFAHGSGSSRHSPRNQFLAQALREAGMGTLLFDLLAPAEEPRDAVAFSLRFDIPLLASRLVAATRWLWKQAEAKGLKTGYCGASTGGAAALVAAAELGDRIDAVVSRGGRPDLAGDALPRVKSPTLLIVGGYDESVMLLNEEAFARLRCKKEYRIVPCATHLFDEPGRLEQVARLTADWFRRHMGPPATEEGMSHE